MTEKETNSQRLLQMSAYAVIVAWGIRYASGFLSIVVLSLLWAYSVLPLPTWLRRRYRVSKGAAIFCTVILLVVLHVVLYLAMLEAHVQMRLKLTFYEQHLQPYMNRLFNFLLLVVSSPHYFPPRVCIVPSMS